MLSYIICGLMGIAVIVALCSGHGEALLDATLSGSQDAVSLCITLLGTMALWSGLFRVAQKAGILSGLAKLLHPITRWLFKGEEDAQTLRYITTNMTANVIGIGNAATPAGLSAMRRMGERSKGKPTSAMAVFCVLNAASIQLIPTTIISMRSSAGSSTPADILACVWIVSFLSAIIGILLIKVLARKL